MNKRPTLRTVAEEAQVSLPTVSQVMRGVGRISDSTRKRVLEAADRVGYVPDESAVTMRTGRTKEVGIIVHFIANHFNSELVGGVSDVLEPLGYSLSVLDAQDDNERVESFVRTILSRKPAGMLWVPGEVVEPSTIPLILKQKVPAITFLRDSGISELSNVSINNEQATYQATKHLIELGHRNLGYFGGMPTSQTRRKRLTGFMNAIREANLNEPMIFDTPESRTIGFHSISDIVNQHPHITALVYYGDELAIGAHLGLTRMGLVAGRDISIVGFDDIEEARLLTPALTTLAINPHQFGQTLARQLLSEINDPKSRPKKIIIDAELSVRDTTKAPG